MLFYIEVFSIFLTGIIFLLYSIYATRNCYNRLIVVFALMNLAMAFFSFGYTWELLSRTMSSAIMGIKLQYFGLSFLSICWINFAYKFRKNRYINSFNTIFICIVPIVTFFLVMTNESHNLFYKSYELISHGNHYSIQLNKGIFYYIFISYTYIILVVLVLSFYKSYKYNKFHFKKQSKIMLIASIMPTIFNIIYLLGLTPKNFDPTPFGFLLMSYFIYKALFNYSFLDLSETIKGSTFDKISEGILVVDTEYRIVDFNPAVRLVLPFLEEEQIGNNISTFTLGKKILEHNKEDYFEIKIKILKKVKSFEFKKNPIFVKGKLVAFIYIISDTTSVKEIVSDLSFLATHDFLTGIHNRRNFFKLADAELYRLMRYGGEFSLIMIDIDFFKTVNDTYGHICGDEVLRGLANLVKKNLRSLDIFARIGGEEFCILLPQTTYEGSQIIAEKIRLEVEKNVFYFNTKMLRITISLGSTYYNSKMNIIPFKELLDLVDKALYTSKFNGRNRNTYLQVPLEIVGSDQNEKNNLD